MDSQHRHELQENVLARWLERQIEFLKPRLPLVLFGVVAAAVAFWAVGLFRSSTESSRYAAWDGFANAMERGQPNLELLATVSQNYEGSPSGELASVTHADGRLYFAAQQYLINRQSANNSMAEAKQEYQQLRGAGDARIRNRAVFGLARVAELEGDLEEAAKLYGQVTGAFAEVAQTRAEELSTDRVKDDYRWLVTAAPVVRRPTGGSQLPSTIPDFSVDAIDTPGDEDESAQTPAEAELTGDQALDELLTGDTDEESGVGSESSADAPADSDDTESVEDAASAEDAAEAE